MTIRFIMIGGFLGAGKTTTIGRLAKAYQARGLKVGIVTNDQATDLVDTHTLRAQGFDVGEVAGACFCCHFNELTKTTEKLTADNLPDVILAEPVGSCTDLVATVVQPLRRLFSEQFEVAPYGVILKPSHGRKILKNEQGSGFSPKAAYIFKKQLEEADFIILNRIDELTEDEASSLVQLIQAANPNISVIRLSAKSGAGFEALLEMLDQRGHFGKRILELDYDIYAAGEAELGWLNSSLSVESAQPIDLDSLLLGIIDRLRDSLAAIGAETAHLKTIGLWEGFYGVANLISSDTPAVLSLPSRCRTQDADVVVNARVAVDPVILEQQVYAAVNAACRAAGATPTFKNTQSFKPGRPVPTHRFADAV
jgi:G3E family GTPase